MKNDIQSNLLLLDFWGPARKFFITRVHYNATSSQWRAIHYLKSGLANKFIIMTSPLYRRKETFVLDFLYHQSCFWITFRMKKMNVLKTLRENLSSMRWSFSSSILGHYHIALYYSRICFYRTRLAPRETTSFFEIPALDKPLLHTSRKLEHAILVLEYCKRLKGDPRLEECYIILQDEVL